MQVNQLIAIILATFSAFTMGFPVTTSKPDSPTGGCNTTEINYPCQMAEDLANCVDREYPFGKVEDCGKCTVIWLYYMKRCALIDITWTVVG